MSEEEKERERERERMIFELLSKPEQKNEGKKKGQFSRL
jgi:hypothetical protein